MTSSSHHDLEKQLEDLLDRFPGFLQHASGSVPLSDLIRLDDLFLKLKLWKHDIKASKGTLGLVPAGSCLMIISEIEISDLLQQIDRLEETFNDHKDVATSGLPKPLEGDLDTLEESVNALVSHVEPFTRLLDPQGIQATSSRRIIGTRILNMVKTVWRRKGSGRRHPSSSPRAATRCQNLLDLISNELVMSEFDNRLFLPKSAFARILSPENIKNALPGANSNLIDFVINKSPKVFATVLQASRKYGKELVAIMGPFLQNNLDDHELYKEDTVACRYGVGDRCSHAVAFNLLHDKSLWSRASVQAFYADRWMFHVPVFSNANLWHFLSSCTILPFEWVDQDSTRNRTGALSRVQKARIHASHQTVLPTSENGLIVALKELRPSNGEDYADPKTRWNLEVAALQETATHRHDHLVRLISAFQRSHKYYLVFEWADGGSLRDFWKDYAKPVLSVELVQDVLQQLRGLASALVWLHSLSNNLDKSHWRHGDLKPDKILRSKCENQRNQLGTLQIADLGLAKRHTDATAARAGQETITQHTTVRYEAPEHNPHDSMSREARSRRYDVWSMGCITLEFVIWLLYGCEGLESFDYQTLLALSKPRKPDAAPDDYGTNFYVTKDGGSEVNGVASKLMSQIAASDPEFENGRKTALSDLLHLVRTRLLVVENKENKTRPRASASDLEEELRFMVDKGMKDPSYLFSGKSRQGANLPIVVDDWKFIVDNEFALDAFREVNTVLPSTITESLCDICGDLNLADPSFRLEGNTTGFSEQRQTSDLCHLLYHACASRGITGKVSLFREGSVLRMQGADLPILSICRGLEVADSFLDVQIGFPTLPPERSETHFGLIRQWLKHCDSQHDCSPKKPSHLPIRLIDVDSKDGADSVRLCETHSGPVDYVALSFCWGNIDKNPPFRTTIGNIQQRVDSGIQISHLPRTFQDAVTVTRELGIRYLWIDAICIIQDDEEDWKEQSRLMGDVFSSAYCVISATRASGMADGFLKPRAPREFVTLSDGSEGCFYVCEAIDDFNRHVIETDLNRGWVYQERSLAQRTIHFAKEQTYWECGDGIRCETLTKMKRYVRAT